MDTFNNCLCGGPVNKIRNLEMCLFIGLNIRTIAGCCDHGNELSVFVWDREFLCCLSDC
jgi:hypothetical protein